MIERGALLNWIITGFCWARVSGSLYCVTYSARRSTKYQSKESIIMDVIGIRVQGKGHLEIQAPWSHGVLQCTSFWLMLKLSGSTIKIRGSYIRFFFRVLCSLSVMRPLLVGLNRASIWYSTAWVQLTERSFGPLDKALNTNWILIPIQTRIFRQSIGPDPPMINSDRAKGEVRWGLDKYQQMKWRTTYVVLLPVAKYRLSSRGRF